MASARGQVLVLGCLVLFGVCLLAIFTAETGQRVHRRIALQNQVDAAAYSAAAVQAQAFNFYAYANRAQVSHYASAMVWHSMLSYFSFTEAFLTDAYGVMRTLNRCGEERSGFWVVACPTLMKTPGVGGVLGALHTLGRLLRDLVVVPFQTALRLADVDAQIGRRVIPALRAKNDELAASSTRAMLAALQQLEEVPRRVFEGSTSAGLSPPHLSLIQPAFNRCAFDRVHRPESNGRPLAPNARSDLPLSPKARLEHDRAALSKRTMAQIANASRAACDSASRSCTAGFVTARADEHAPLPEWLAPVKVVLASFPKWGQTRLLSAEAGPGEETGAGTNPIRHFKEPPGHPQGPLAQGDILGADDLYEMKLGPTSLGPFRNPFACDVDKPYFECWGSPERGGGDDASLPFRFMLKTSVFASPGGGLHWRVKYPGYPAGEGGFDPGGPEREMGLHAARVCVLPRGCRGGGGLSVQVFVANVHPIRDGNHPWRGIAPFPHFEPGRFLEDCREESPRPQDRAALFADGFNQPAVWMIARTEGETRGKIAAAARAQTYYHRPGAWPEPPNFFNPYWRPRLAALAQGRSEGPWRTFVEALPEPFREAPEKVVLH